MLSIKSFPKKILFFQTRTRIRGFSLVELSLVLVIIGLIIGAVSIGKDIHRNAANQRIASEFIQGWLLAYDSFAAGTGHVPGDALSAPTGCVGASCATTITAGVPLCDGDTDLKLRQTMIQAGIGLPTGRAEGLESRYVYLDSNGLPHELQVCFQSVAWSEPAPQAGSFVIRPRNVMVLQGVTPALASFIDHYFDTVIDARFGNVREAVLANSTGGNTQAWSKNETQSIEDDSNVAFDESQVSEMRVYIRMHR